MTRTDTWHKIVVVDRVKARAAAKAAAAAVIVAVAVAAVKADAVVKAEIRPSACCRFAGAPAS